MDYEKAQMNGTAGPRYVNPAVVARPESEVATGKDTTPRYVGKRSQLLILQGKINNSYSPKTYSIQLYIYIK